MNPLVILEQRGRYASPWTRRTRLRVLCWMVVWLVLFRPTPKHLKAWRLWLLRLFGCRISGSPYVAPSARIKMPWNLVLEDHACLGPESETYNLATITLNARCTVSQQVYLCAGTHDFSTPDLPLVVGEIMVGENAFIGVRALVLPGVSIGEGAVVGAGSVVARDVPEWMICAGNPCRPLRPREFGSRTNP